MIMNSSWKHLNPMKEVTHENPCGVTHPGRHRRQSQIPQRSPAGPTGTLVFPGWQSPGCHRPLTGYVTVLNPVKKGGRKRHGHRYPYRQILGPAVRVERHRGWATFWCPFHNNSDRAGRGGHPNFGVHLLDGYWKCLRCKASGGSLKSLSYKLGVNWKSPVSMATPTHRKRPPTQVEQLDEAMAEARANVQHSPAWAYLAGRGLHPYTSLVYGLGYGLPVPAVHRNVIEAARQSLMLRRDGTWLWAGGVVYADPPTHPAVLNVRYIPAEQLPKGTRQFTPKKNHKTWGRRVQPLGAWRITGSTRTLVVLEGLFGMLVTAQKLHDLGRETDTVARQLTACAHPTHSTRTKPS